MFKSRAEKNFPCFCCSKQNFFLRRSSGCSIFFFDGCFRSRKYLHQRKCFFDRALGVGRKRSEKKMKFENDFRFHLNRIFFNLLFTTFRCRPLRNKPSDHRIMQYKVYDISLSCHSVKRRENPKVTIFICSLYERSSILSVTTLICSFLV